MLVDTQGQVAESAVDAARRQRGPMRPEQLVSARRRQDRRLAGHRFRAVDTLFLIAVSGFFLQRMVGRAVLETPLGEVLPIAVGVWSTWWLVRSLGLYRFGRSERIIVHFGGVVLASAVGAGVASLLIWALPVDDAPSTTPRPPTPSS